MFNKTDEEIKIQFNNLRSRIDVASLLEIEDKSLRYILYANGANSYYYSFSIPKKKGGNREINAPRDELKSIQKKLAYLLNLVYQVKPPAHGFVINRNISSNAQMHINKRNVFNIDLKDFFSQIHFGRVMGMFMKPPYNIGKEAATTLAQIACYNRKLPQGSPCSPILTNMICSPLDTQLLRLAKKNNAIYSRYADDITFSTNKKDFSKDISYYSDKLYIGNKLNTIIRKNSFVVNENKIFLNKRYTRQEVTGLIVNKKVNIKREYIKLIRAILYNCQKKKSSIYNEAKKLFEKGSYHGYIAQIINDKDKQKYIEQWFKNVLAGKISFVKQIRGEVDFIYLKLAYDFNKVFNDRYFNVDKLDKFNNLIIKNTVVIDDLNDTLYENYVQGSGFLLKDIGLVTNYHVTKSGNSFNVYLHDKYPNKIATISNEKSFIKSNKDIDYAIYKYSKNNETFFELGDSDDLRLGDKVILIGYPDYVKGNTPTIQPTYISGKKKFLGVPFFTVNSNIYHGASGGVVLNTNNKVVGIIKGGVCAYTEDASTNINHGFIPINLVLDDLQKTP